MPDTQEVMFVSESLALTLLMWPLVSEDTYGDDEDLIFIRKIYQVIKIREVGIVKEVKRSDG